MKDMTFEEAKKLLAQTILDKVEEPEEKLIAFAALALYCDIADSLRRIANSVDGSKPILVHVTDVPF